MHKLSLSNNLSPFRTRVCNYKDITFYTNKLNEKIKSVNNRRVPDSERELAFNKFLDAQIELTGECKTSSDLFQLNDKYEAFICGSDQIWAPSLFNSKYFLDFVEDPNKIIAYAPSIGLSNIEDVYVKNCMKKSIERFQHLSIREKQGQKLIQQLCNKEAQVVLDPTLLLSSEEWDNMAVSTKQKSPYILCYFLGNNKDTWKNVRQISKATKIPLKIIPVFKKDYKRDGDVVPGIGPGEFLDLVRNASLVCTDSFHGTAFSIIYEKPFYVYERFNNKDSNSQNSRVYNILKITGLENRLIKDKATVNNAPLSCEYGKAREKLKIKREESLLYLSDALNASTPSTNENKEYKITNTCCGCGVCSIVCPQGAIEIKRNADGFLDATIDQSKCIKCGLCRLVCPFNGEDGVQINEEKYNLYMLKSKDKSVLNSSSSGGAAYEISKKLCNDGYDVVGCTYDKEQQEAVHKKVSAGDIGGLEDFKGSKYIQSNTVDVFSEVVDETEKAVIIGTPCQIAGIDRLLRLKKRRTNYILIDLICHGVPSQHLWRKYIKTGSEKYGYGLTPKVQFRDKSKGWDRKYMSVEGNKKAYSMLEKKDSFYKFFLSNNCYMSSCYECNYREKTSADIRVGDYWGPRYKGDKDGVSMVISMTNTGEEILQELKRLDKIELENRSCEEYWTVQYPRNPIKPVFYNELINDFKDDSLTMDEVTEKYCSGFELHENLKIPYSFMNSFARKLVRGRQ